jgi:hypothetical protein
VDEAMFSTKKVVGIQKYSWNKDLKGTVSPDFRLLVFFMDQFPQASEYTTKAISIFFRKFAEIFAAQGTPPVSTAPVANGKNLQAEKF